MRKGCLPVVAALIALSMLESARVVHGTQLRLHAKNDRGEAIHLTTAELLPVRWNEMSDPIRLELDDEQLVLELDEAWLRSRWPHRLADMEGVYLYLEADGYASIRSEKFLWLGAHGPPYGPRVTQTQIAFPNGSRVVVREGQKAEMELTLRKPIRRSLRLVDDRAKPVQGVRVASFMFWSASNHCGILSGAKPLGEGTSDQDGRVTVADGDFEYAFSLDLLGRHYALKDTGSFSFTNREDADEFFVTRLRAPETTVRLHRLRTAPLNLRVWKDGKPVGDETLSGRPAPCPCGGGCVAWLATSDDDGWIRISDFYPEQWSGVFFGDEDEPLWEVDPEKLPPGSVVRVDLKSNPASQPTPKEGAAER